ncbi:forkhead box protein N3 isoform X1 [Corythoichthys intestinalis]|uniref:forkhead box protein N3 isoform X1 n=1 Tax=Corythoichthys intestinalis TaxID=161448 RepID=UPI0025A5757C|nr:forkhead box protein N3 isoform X1 [Corythoichthys intestinalis]
MENLCQSLAPLSPCPFSPSCHPGSLSPISFPPSPSLSRSAHGESSLSPPSQRYSEAARDQDDLTCLSWLHQRGDLLPLRPLPKAPPPPGGGTEVDPGSAKPPYSFSSLIFMAIEDSSDKRLPVKDIYGWIVDKFPYYRTAGAGWRNSVRHNLSLSKSFCRMERDKSQSVGKGSLWCVSPEHRASLLEVLRKTHAYHSANSSLINKPALLEDVDYSGSVVCDSMEMADCLPHTLTLSPPAPTADFPPTPEREDPEGRPDRDPLADGGYIELRYYQSPEYQYLVLPDDTELDLETVEILQLDAEAQEAAGSLLDLAGSAH